LPDGSVWFTQTTKGNIVRIAELQLRGGAGNFLPPQLKLSDPAGTRVWLDQPPV
jgi:hypothetical protein